MSFTRRPGRAAWSVLRVVPAVAWAAGIWALSATPEPPGSGWAELPMADKVAHTGLFLVQALLLRLAGLGAPSALMLAVAWGALDEVHQTRVPGRTGDPWDLLADAFGAVLGANLVEWVARGRGVHR